MSAPTSRSTLKPLLFRDGHRHAIAGRLTPGARFNFTMDTAIRAPVFPQEIATSASFWRTVSIADHMDVPSPWRSTELGFIAIVTTPSQWRTSHFLPRLRLAILLTSSALSPCTTNFKFGCFRAARAKPSITALGPLSPPIASTDTTATASFGFGVFSEAMSKGEAGQ